MLRLCFHMLLLSCLTTVVWAQKAVTFKAADGLKVHADYYASEADGPLIVAAHQAGWSRGEYAETARWLNKQGFAVLAVDARSGGEVNGVINLTHQGAKKRGLATEYLDAKQDLEAALKFARESYKPTALYLLGSSYSASLALLIAGERKLDIDAVIAFSPGEYFADKQLIQRAATDIAVPAFITSARGEGDYWQPIAAKIDAQHRNTFLPSKEGDHGSRALWSSKAASQLYRGALRAFLIRLTQSQSKE